MLEWIIKNPQKKWKTAISHLFLWHGRRKTWKENTFHWHFHKTRENMKMKRKKLSFVKKILLSLKCPIYEMLYLWNVLSMKCPIYEMSYLWNVLSMKCPFYEMSFLWNDLSMKWPICDIVISIKCLSMKCPNAIINTWWTILYFEERDAINMQTMQNNFFLRLSICR